MNSYLKIIAGLLFILVILSACVTNKKLTYLQPKDSINDTSITYKSNNYTVQAHDNLIIRVTTPDPSLSAMFNNSPTGTTSMGMSEISADISSYPVDANGNLRFPYVGNINVGGKTTDSIASDIEKGLRNYINDAHVTVKMVNNYISIVGEIQRPGRYPIYKTRLNIFQAIALSGDLNEFSNRSKVQLIRQTANGVIVKQLNLSDRSILTSEYFYVLPNDVIYVQPIKGKFFRMNVFPYTVVLSTITTFLLILNFLK